MNTEEKATQIFNLFWLSIRMITRKKAIELSVIHVNGIIEALESLDNDYPAKATIEYYQKVKEVIQSFQK